MASWLAVNDGVDESVYAWLGVLICDCEPEGVPDVVCEAVPDEDAEVVMLSVPDGVDEGVGSCVKDGVCVCEELIVCD